MVEVIVASVRNTDRNTIANIIIILIDCICFNKKICKKAACTVFLHNRHYIGNKHRAIWASLQPYPKPKPRYCIFSPKFIQFD